MKIAFLCSSLEPGRDGVGDYSTLLARECARQGHPTALIALNDRHSTQTVEGVLTASESAHAEDISYMRLPSSEDRAGRTAKAIAFLREFAPDWISLQFVSYGFQDKGFVANQVWYLRNLAQALSSAQTHIMLHELWIGGVPDSPVKDRVIGAIQRYYICKLIKAWAPAVRHTSNEYYREKLAACGLTRTEILPLFGNVPIVDKVSKDALIPLLGEKIPSFLAHSRPAFLIGGFFGTLHTEWSPEPTISYLEEAATNMGRKLMLLSAGRIGRQGELLWAMIKQRYGSTIQIWDLGEQSAEFVSEYLSNLDFGISASLASLIGKSSTTATMLDHGLPVIVSRGESRALAPWDDRSRTLLRFADSGLPDWIANGLPRLPPVSSLPAIARRFAQSLSEAV